MKSSYLFLFFFSFTSWCYEPICNQYALIEALEQGSVVVPKEIYHYGKKEYMLDNIERTTIEQHTWDHFIMGEGTRFRYQSQLRKGLYGTLSPLDNDFASEEHNWINIIEIKDECRQSKSTFSLIKIFENRSFRHWFANRAHQLTIEQFREQCFDHVGRPLMNYYGEFTMPWCEPILTHFFETFPVRVVHDHFLNHSWYIRDRNCIANISGGDQDLAEMLMDQKSVIFQNWCGRDRYHQHFLDIMTSAINNLPDSSSYQQPLKSFQEMLERMF